MKKAESHKTEDSEQTSTSQPGDEVENVQNIEIQTDSGNVRKSKKPLILSLPPVSTLKAAALTAASKEPKIPKARKTSPKPQSSKVAASTTAKASADKESAHAGSSTVKRKRRAPKQKKDPNGAVGALAHLPTATRRANVLAALPVCAA